MIEENQPQETSTSLNSKNTQEKGGNEILETDLIDSNNILKENIQDINSHEIGYFMNQKRRQLN